MQTTEKQQQLDAGGVVVFEMSGEEYVWALAWRALHTPGPERLEALVETLEPCAPLYRQKALRLYVSAQPLVSERRVCDLIAALLELAVSRGLASTRLLRAFLRALGQEVLTDEHVVRLCLWPL